MDIVVKNVTKSYRKDYRKKKIVGSIFLFTTTLILLIACLLPFAYIDNVSIGNTFEIGLQAIKNLINKENNSIAHLGYFLTISFAFIITTILTLIGGIEGLKEKDEDLMYMDEKDLTIQLSPKYIFKQVFRFFIFSLIYILIAHPTKLVTERFGFTFTLNWCVFLVCFLFWIKGMVCDYITLKYDEKGSFSRQEILDREKKENKHTKNKRESKKKGASPNKFFTGLSFFFVWVIIFFTVLSSAFIAFQYYNAMFGGYNMLGFNSVAGWVVTLQEEGKLVFDKKTLIGGYNRQVCMQGFGDFEIGLEIIDGKYESNTKTFTFYGDAYRYNCIKIKELTKQRNELWPDGNDEDAFKKYLETVENLTKAIDVMQSKVNLGHFAYERVSFENGFMIDLQYNATGIDKVKWGEKAEGLSAIFFRERIKLTDFYCETKKSMDMFAVGTDFSKELIVARVTYNDGSVRISKIKPSNVEELNNASAGKHLLKWQDSWGKYETQVTLY